MFGGRMFAAKAPSSPAAACGESATHPPGSCAGEFLPLQDPKPWIWLLPTVPWWDSCRQLHRRDESSTQSDHHLKPDRHVRGRGESEEGSGLPTTCGQAAPAVGLAAGDRHVGVAG
jgi:hypothetical protein